ncbi:hypothetical protein CALVIDRAFT_541285 [Calocera viscosa TUFC12733]|uniref:Uncharacterized protein n=1 Tax=Calocera viscosa (strain TUFC12733) TaxID=1330018 RepID=A0A167HXS4_CALVF|nr:hypothetical protein CALVIDRAFT_541285 [Calocera viscosa TUFC12733]
MQMLLAGILVRELAPLPVPFPFPGHHRCTTLAAQASAAGRLPALPVPVREERWKSSL